VRGGSTLTRLTALGTLSRNAGEELKLKMQRRKALSRTAGEGGASPLRGWVGEGLFEHYAPMSQ
jgi:hypothetical protein